MAWQEEELYSEEEEEEYSDEVSITVMPSSRDGFIHSDALQTFYDCALAFTINMGFDYSISKIYAEISHDVHQLTDECRLYSVESTLLTCELATRFKIRYFKNDSRREPTVDIKLSTVPQEVVGRVRYNFTSREFLPCEELLIDLLTLPSQAMLKEDLRLLEEKRAAENNGRRETTSDEQSPDGLEGCEDVISQEELQKLDSQPNPFNFSERVSQTSKCITQDEAVQTDPPPSTTFCVNVGASDIYDAYERDYVKKQAIELQLEEKSNDKSSKKQEKEASSQQASQLSAPTPIAGPSEASSADSIFPHLNSDQLKDLSFTVKIIERMVNQNTYDEIVQDFRFWEDQSDDFRGREGSLLPLWRFSSAALSAVPGYWCGRNAVLSERVRGLLVTGISFSTVYSDFFAASFSSAESVGSEGAGAVCLYSFKNPSHPEQVVLVQYGVTALQFHPRMTTLLVVGLSNGDVAVYDVTPSQELTKICSSAVTGKHLLSITQQLQDLNWPCTHPRPLKPLLLHERCRAQVRWTHTGCGEKLSFISSSLDGRVTQWKVVGVALQATDLLHFPCSGAPSSQLCQDASTKRTSPSEGTSSRISDVSSSVQNDQVVLEVKPDDDSVLLLGATSGAVFQCSTASTVHSLVRYSAHCAPLRALAWNCHNFRVFLTASMDGTLKVWLQNHLAPLVVMSLGGPVAAVVWAPYSSTVIVAATDEGRLFVYDLNVRRCRPLCSQPLPQKKRILVASIAVSPHHPVAIVGGERGYLASFKLSPNLRRPHKEAKGADEQKLKEIEIAKIERIIATNRG
ncbi:WD40-repeat-containing domain [Trinorchestia longiramus]|nr:WD40-repeat-containing domain [Trinorchestia longiramus]